MGRRPNQLVLKFFHRGPKLNDNSNRYEQTCKACGELFRKGRIEILTKHIERCSAVYNQDDGNIDVPSAYALSEKYLTLSTGSGHHGSGHHLSGLEALAEASCRRDRDHLIDPNLQEDEPDAKNTSIARKGLNVTNTAYAIPGVAQSNIASSLIKYISHDTLRDHLTTESITGCPPTTLSMIAASATNLEATMLQNGGDSQQTYAKPKDETALAMSSPSLGSKSASVQPSSEDNFMCIEKPQQMTSNTALQAASRAGTSIATDISGHRRPCGRAQKVRGKFSDLRRQEVQNIRKQGACIRCRMLRKTCSEDNPCKTCASVTCARIWKLDCVRTNIYKELEIYSSNLFTSIASNYIQSATSSQVMNPQRRILKMSLEGQSPRDINLQILLVGGRVSESNEVLSRKLLQFLRASATILYSVEGSSIIRKSVFLAYELANKNEDRLLFQVLELWRLTNIMCRKDCWHLTFETLSEEDKPQELNGSEGPHSANIAYAQIRAVAEMHASSLSKNVMIELEKRLGRKERCQGFGTFLVGVILLNCIERMVWSLKAYSSELKMTEVPSMKSIDPYVEQAESFSEFISKLFGMRGIILRVRTNQENGVLQTIATNAPIAKGWLTKIELTNNLLAGIRVAQLDISNFRSLDFKYCSKLILVGWPEQKG